MLSLLSETQLAAARQRAGSLPSAISRKAPCCALRFVDLNFYWHFYGMEICCYCGVARERHPQPHEPVEAQALAYAKRIAAVAYEKRRAREVANA